LNLTRSNSKEKKYINQIKGDKIIVNTLCKMAQKRSLVGAVLIVCGASEYFTQDLED
jgi:2-C-methyl-D-erythritol 4-phosphate cytidylyltransferase